MDKISKGGLTDKIKTDNVVYWRKASLEDIQDYMKDKPRTLENVDRSLQQLNEGVVRQWTDAFYLREMLAGILQ